MILRNDTAQFLLNLLARFSLELQHINLQLCLLKGISKKLSNIKRMIRNKIAQFLLHLSATLSKVMELCSLDIPSISSHSVPEADHYSACNPHGEELKVWTLLKVKELLRHHPQLPNPKLKMMMQLLKTMLQLLVWPSPLRSPLFFCRTRLTCQRRRSSLQWSSRIPAWLSPSWTWNWNCYPAKVEVPKTKKPLPL